MIMSISFDSYQQDAITTYSKNMFSIVWFNNHQREVNLKMKDILNKAHLEVQLIN